MQPPRNLVGLQRLTIADLVRRQRTLTYNPNLTPTAKSPATPQAVAADAEQAERDWFFSQLIDECRAGFVRETRRAWLLAEAGRTQKELDDALDTNFCFLSHSN